MVKIHFYTYRQPKHGKWKILCENAYVVHPKFHEWQNDRFRRENERFFDPSRSYGDKHFVTAWRLVTCEKCLQKIIEQKEIELATMKQRLGDL